MTAYAGAFVLKNALFTLGATDYANQCTSLSLTPDEPTQSLRTLVPDGQINDIDSAEWTFSIKAVQDHETAGLAAYLNANAGSIVTAVYAPHKGTGKQEWTFSVLIKSVPVGGDQGNYATFEIDLPVQGQPVKSAQS
jgi:hypothetical protein